MPKVTDEHLLLLYKRHLSHQGMSKQTVEAKTKIPGSRIDLVDHYTSILQGETLCPPWAKPLPE